MKLYEISDTLRRVIEGATVLDDETGELLDIDNMNELQCSFDDKLEGCAVVVKELKAEAEALKAEAGRLNARAKSAENRADGLKRYMLRQMQAVGQNSLKTSKVEVKTSSSKFVEITSDKDIPDCFQTFSTIIKPDKTAIMKALKAGDEVPGAKIGIRESLRVS